MSPKLSVFTKCKLLGDQDTANRQPDAGCSWIARKSSGVLPPNALRCSPQRPTKAVGQGCLQWLKNGSLGLMDPAGLKAWKASCATSTTGR
jgi:hypothetical protein